MHSNGPLPASTNEGEQVAGPIGHPAWTPVLPMAAMPPGARPRVMAYYKNRPDFTVTLRSDIVQHLDVQVLDMAQQGSPTVTIVNIYNDPKLNRESPAYQLRNMPLPNNHPVLITGDWNLHHPLWSANLCANNELTNNVVEWLTAVCICLAVLRVTKYICRFQSRKQNKDISTTAAPIHKISRLGHPHRLAPGLGRHIKSFQVISHPKLVAFPQNTTPSPPKQHPSCDGCVDHGSGDIPYFT